MAPGSRRYALFQGVCVNRFAEVMDVGDVFSLLRRCGQADLGGVAEVFEDLAPSRVFGRAAAVAFVNDDEVEEIG